MRTLFLTLLFFLSLCIAKAQQMATYADTSKYLVEEIEGKKSKYVGKPFSVLLADLKLKPIYIIQGDWNGLDTDKPIFGRNLSIEFNKERDFNKSHFIRVDFKNQPSYDVLYPLFFPSDKNRDINKILAAYKNVIVTDVGAKLYEQDNMPEYNE